MDVCAGIVLYNPSQERLTENITAVIDQVSVILLVDNGSKNIQDIEKSLELFDSQKIKLIRNDKNLGIGKALNQILDFSKNNEFEWFLTLDQDSICKPGLIGNYVSFLSDRTNRRIGQLTCNIQDEKLGEIEKKKYNGKDWLEVESCITSGAFNNAFALEESGRYNEKFFIDGVDIEVSLRLRKTGFSVIKLNFNGLDHSLGDGKQISFLFSQMSLNITGAFYQVSNNTKLLAFAGGFSAMFIIFGVLAGLYIGTIKAVAACYFVAQCINFISMLWIMSHKLFRRSIEDITKEIRKLLIISVTVYFLAKITCNYITFDVLFLSFIFKMFVVAIFYFVLLYIMHLDHYIIKLVFPGYKH